MEARSIVAVVCLFSTLTDVTWQQEVSIPSFAILPTQLVEFSNMTGARIPCSANFKPFPSNISWLGADGFLMKPISGLREVQSDGTLVLLPFSAEQFRQDVHSTSYKCAISNKVGTIVSNDVVVKAVVLQPYDVYVYDVFTMRGSTAVMKCHVPKVISRYVNAISWIKDSAQTVSVSGMAQESRFNIIPSGELYIKDVSASDAGSTFDCITTNKLTGEVKKSVTSGKLFVTGPQGNVVPKITFSRKTVLAKKGEMALLPCEAQGHPLPNIKWTRRAEIDRDAGFSIEGRYSLVSGSLLINDVQPSDSDVYYCTASNTAGSVTAEVQLIIPDPPLVTVDPKQLIVDSGQPATFSCKVVGSPVTSIMWMKDGQPLTLLPAIEIQSNTSFRITSVTSDHKGIFQCFAKSTFGDAFAVATLTLGDTPPLLVSGFKERNLQPFTSVTLQCSFAGSPAPVVMWFLDGQLVPNHIVQTQSVTTDDNIISAITIKNVQTQDGGQFTCQASNKAGKMTHNARLNVYGLLGTRQHTKITAVSGQTVVINCPFFGYPFRNIEWEKDDRHLPSNLRQVVEKDNLIIHKVHRIADTGVYKCSVHQESSTVKSEVHLTVMVQPKLAPFSFQDELVREGMRGRLQCVVLEGDLPIQISWLKDSQPIPVYLGVTVREIDEFSSILTIPSISPRHNGNYTCLAKNPAATVTFSAALSVNGMRAHIICAVSQGDLPLHFHWLKDDLPVPISLGVVTRSYDGHANSLSIESVSSEHTGNYTCVVSNEASTVQHTAQLLVHVAPKIIPFTFQESGVVEGVLARVSCVVYQGDLPIEINWFKDGKAVSSLSGITFRTIDDYSSILTIENSASQHSGNYSCVAKNAAATVVHNAQLIVNVPPKIVPFSFQDEQLVEGLLIRVSCVVSRGDLPLNITWVKDGLPIPTALSVSTRAFDEYSSVLSIDPVSNKHNGNYTCIARNHAASAFHTTELKIQVPPKWLVEPMDVTAKSGQTVFLHCRADGLPEPTITWMWAKDSRSNRAPILPNTDVLILRNGSVLLHRITKEMEGFYFCSASNGVGEGLSKSVIVHILAPPMFREKVVRAIGNKGENLTLMCSAYGDQPINFVWSMDRSIFINPSKDTRYMIKTDTLENDAFVTSALTIAWLDRKDSVQYTCQADNEFGNDKMQFHVTVQELPDAPVMDSAKGGNRSVTISWQLSFDGNNRVANYVVQYKKEVDNWHTRAMNITSPGDATSLQVSELQPAASYNFRVAAQNAIGLGAFSNVVTCATLEDAPTGTPLNVEVESTDQHTLRVTWKPPRKSQWNGAIRGYEIGYKEVKSSDSYTFHNLEVPEDYTEDLIYQLADLKMYTQYSVIVQAYNSRGKGPASEPVVSMTSEDVPSSPPQGIRCSALSSKSIYVLWDPPIADSVNGIIRGYKILYKPVTEWYDSAVRMKSTPAMKITLQELDVNTNYTIQILAFTKVGDGAKSQPLYCKTHEDVPESPQEIKVLPSSSDSVVVAWKSPKNSNGGITKYNVYYKPLEQGQEINPASDGIDAVALMTEQVSPDASSHTSRSDNQFLEVKGLKKNKKYAFWVTASSVIGEGPSSKIMAQTVADSTVPAKSASFDGTLKAPWKRDVVLPCKAVGVPPPQRKWMIGDKPLEVAGKNILLSDGTLLINQVASEDSGNYTCVIYNEHGKDNVKYALVVQGYILHFRAENDVWETKELSPDYHLYTLDGLDCGSTYQMYLEAFNSIGTGPPCDVITVATEGSEKSSPTKDSVIREGSTYVTIHLEAWPSTGCPIEKFHVEYKTLYAQDWTLVSDTLRPSQKKLVIPGLKPGTWYTSRITAETNGKKNVAEYKFATLTLSGGTIPPPEIRIDHTPEPVYLFYLDPYIFIPTVALLIVVIIASVIICVCVKRKSGSMGSPSDSDTTINTWSRSMRHGSHGNSQYPTLHHRGSKDTNPYASAQLPDCILQHPYSDAFLGHSEHPQPWLGTLGRRPVHVPQGTPGMHGFQAECIQHACNDSDMMHMQGTTFAFPASNQARFTPSKGDKRSNEDYDQPPVGI